MNLFKVLLSILAFSSVANANLPNEALSELVRNSCSNFPEVTQLKAATPGLHYRMTLEYDPICDECAVKDLNLVTNYRYTVVKVIDYYNSAGKLVATRTQKEPASIVERSIESVRGKWNHSNEHTGLLPADSVAQAVLARMYGEAVEEVAMRIRSALFNGTEACPGSFYK